MALYLPVNLSWNASPLRSSSDEVGFYFEDAGGVQRQMVTGIPYTALTWTYVGFSKELPDNDFFIHMTINGTPTGEVVTCHLVIRWQ